MSSPPITPHLPQSQDVISHLPSQVSLNGHGGELGGDVVYCFRGQLADFCAGEDGEFGQDAGAVFCADAVEGFEAVLGSVSGCDGEGKSRMGRREEGEKLPLAAGFRGSCFLG